MKEKWKQIESILTDKKALSYLHLNEGATAEQLTSLEKHIGVTLPDSIHEFLMVHNGQTPASGPGLFFGVEFLSVDQIRKNWDDWVDAEDEGLNEEMEDSMSSKPEGVIKPLYQNRKWIPLTSDHGGNHIGIDFDPDAKGIVGQIIAYGRDQDMKILKAKNFEEFVDHYISQLLSIAWSLKLDHWEIADKSFDIHYNDWEWSTVEKIELYPDGTPENYVSIWVSTKPVQELPYEYYFGQFKDDFHIKASYDSHDFTYGADEKAPLEKIVRNSPIFSGIMEPVKKRLSQLGISEMTYVHVAKEYSYEAENTGIQENEHFVFIGSFRIK